jgi:non-specific serine/threonine protein kinase
MAETLDEPEASVDSLMLLGVVAESTGDQIGAADYYDRALARARALATPQVLLTALEYSGLLAQARGQLSLARSIFDEAVTIAGEQPQEWARARPLAALGYVLLEIGDFTAAEVAFRERLAIWQRLRNARNCAISVSSFGTLAVARGDLARARQDYFTALQGYRECDEQEGWPYFLTCCATLAAAQGLADKAARIGGAAEALREDVGAISLPAPRAWTERQLRKLCATSPISVWSRGASMSLEQAIAEAFATLDADATLADGASLTPREREVARLVTQGLTNRAIAVALVVSERTVDAHVEHIRAKLGLRSRAHLAAWASAHGLATGPAIRAFYG